jgi:hypothetical protein
MSRQLCYMYMFYQPYPLACATVLFSKMNLQFRHYEKVPIILLAVLVIINAC